MKKKISLTSLAARAFLISLVLISAIVWCRMLTAKFVLPYVDDSNYFVKAVMYGTEYEIPPEAEKEAESVWLKKYPFKNNAPDSIVSPEKPEHSSVWSILNQKFKDNWNTYSSQADDFSTKYLPLYETMTKTLNKGKAAIGWDISDPNTYNQVVFLDDGYLGMCNSRFDYETAEKSLNSFKKFCDSQNLPLLYVAAPSKINPNDKKIYGIVDFSAQNTQGFLEEAEKDNIDFYDLTNDIDSLSPDRHKAYFKTDMHWTGQTGLFAAKKISQRLNKKMGWSLASELLNNNRFRGDLYKKALLGAQGRKVTTAVAQPEDITFLYPKYKTNIKIDIPTTPFNRHGDFSVLYYQELLDIIKDGNPDYNSHDPYAAYLYSGNPLTKITNYKADNDIRLLVIYDSFGRTTVPYLSLCIKQIDCIDLRRFDGSLETYIMKESPYDAVLIIYSPGSMGLKGDGKFLFDFR